MYVSYNWLNEYVDLTGVTPQELAEKITKAGIEVEHVTFLGEGIRDVVVGYVESCDRHPNADKLNVCQVNIGAEENVQIICGAPNVAAGQKVVVAKVGAVLPGNFKIKKAKLRGEVSQGMICSLQELGIEDKFVPKEFAHGIYVLEEEAEVGADALPYLNLNDYVLELDILPNSAHCLNMIGVAYEVASILDRDICLPKPELHESRVEAASKVSIEVADQDKVPFYGARIVEGIKVGPSPRWLQQRLMAAGVRPISNIVDISNFVMLEYGQPLHTFDFDAFGSDRVLVRQAEEGEKLTTLDDTERTLTSEDLVITNGEKAVAIAGVMGGADSEVSDTTQTVLLESAIFDSLSIRRTSTRLGLRTDASSRYEKGIDRNRAADAAARAAELMEQLAGATVLKGIVHEGAVEVPPSTIDMPWQKINHVLGTQLLEEEILSVFRRLRFGAKIEGDTLHVAVPTRRPDVTIPEDLVEEVGRTYGYDHVPATLPEGSSTTGQLTDYQLKRRKVQRLMEGAGLYQTVTYSLTTEEKAHLISSIDEQKHTPVRLAMPMSEERAVLRVGLIPELLEVVRYHLNRQMPNIKVFEMGRVFHADEETLTDLPEEKEHLVGALTGTREDSGWYSKQQAIDFFTVKGIIERLFDAFDLTERVSYEAADREGMHPGRTANVLLDHVVVGFLGQIHPTLQNELDLKETYVFELDIETILNAENEALSYTLLPRYPAMTRDIALVVDEAITSGQLVQVIKSTGAPLLKEVKLFDIYRGESLGEGKKSMAYALKYLDPEKTLTDKEVEKVHQKVLEACETQLGAVLRG
ncbi:phenylalanyl-tRNA synthetase beta chain [Pullulanibacillus pueri]|uniref:Phenylalanine--tRNA ligase beta subunit n=1 Tax=Pullulanibacillus pueri TaxID=1437324 RepID=A0A8J3EP89_9BACL|nr:phenylalanine--tRNA ligase subunit beta [Pullulanibacillus pueri]MBM7682014.1 phenylalanyl-tRNA synthetase beta chain [Pullulanibacillus pueri]GGH88228.1 phenylalanine--tRNA ligase beta subunit [Pullulanibacillus pueri]